MNLGQLVELAIGKAMGPTEAPERLLAVNKSLVRALVNTGYHRIERAAMWKFSEAQATLLFNAGNPNPTNWPPDVAVPLIVFDPATERELEFHDARQRFHITRSGARPETYSLWNQIITVTPVPTTSYSLELRYYRHWPDLLADEDEPLFPATWHEILADYAAAKLLLRAPARGERDLSESQARPFEQAWQHGLAEMLASPLAMPTADIILSHQVMDAVDLGAGVDW